jgi:hypothetical protein
VLDQLYDPIVLPPGSAMFDTLEELEGYAQPVIGLSPTIPSGVCFSAALRATGAHRIKPAGR